ncbi:MAG: sulfur carrier protein ThiS [Candidatus Omnitrophica bacterium]|nr:sulfur carrier protein ThiS [Candidatus Omnitrophota bacterium]
MEIRINGKQKSVPDHLSLKGLLDHLELQQGGLAVEVNGKIVRRQDHEDWDIRENDSLEIVHLIGGG